MKKYSTSKAAQMLDVSTATLKRWYKWYESEDFKKPDGLILPDYERDNRGTRFFSDADLIVLKNFKINLQNGEYRGCMADYNAKYQWGKRGKERRKK